MIVRKRKVERGDTMPEDKFRWKKGDVIIKLSQCAYCKNALDYATCAEFGTKPKKYRYNEEPCARRIPEK